MPIPDDVTLKLKHATRHLQTLNAQLGDFGERDPYDSVTEIHKYTGYQGRSVIRMKVNRDPLPEWSLTIGDCAHNLRTVLDYATLALWRAHSGEPTDDEIDKIMFPIYTTQKGFRNGRKRKIGGLHPGAKRVIRKAQPYQTRHNPNLHPLQVLTDLDNYDKHRFLHTTHAVTKDSKLEILEQENLIITDKPAPRLGGFKDGDVIVSLGILAIAPNPKLNVKLKTTYDIAFDQSGPGRGEPVAELLNRLRLFIRDTVLVALEPYF